MKKLRIDIWSDIACPWCYVGKRRLEHALERFPQRDQVEIVWRAFELDPSAPAERDRSASYAERLARKYGRTVPQAQAMIDRMTTMGRADALDFNFAVVRSGNMFDAHRMLHLALERGLQNQLKERLFAAYMTEGELLSDHDTLVRLSQEVGLDGDEVREVLASGRFAEEVRADELEAQELGINGVPFFVLDGRYAISGAQPAELLLAAIERAFDELSAEPLDLGEGAVCGPDGC